jgi:hypothetical protein
MKRRADRRGIDQTMAAYVEWKEHSVAVQSTYNRWAGARRTDSRAAYLAYAVALDREARASEEYAGMVDCARGGARP